MINSILARLGYVRIPKAAVQASLQTESILREIAEKMEVAAPERAEYYRGYARNAHALTEFLAVGRMLR